MFLERYHSQKESSMIFTNESFAVPSKYCALMELVQRASSDLCGDDFLLKTLGFWGCNISSSKLDEVLGYLKGSLMALEISEGKTELKKNAIKSISEIFEFPEFEQDKVSKKGPLRLLI
jgi:hypothetical protein